MEKVPSIRPTTKQQDIGCPPLTDEEEDIDSDTPPSFSDAKAAAKKKVYYSHYIFMSYSYHLQCESSMDTPSIVVIDEKAMAKEKVFNAHTQNYIILPCFFVQQAEQKALADNLQFGLNQKGAGRGGGASGGGGDDGGRRGGYDRGGRKGGSKKKK